ncbi:MAG: hypothetical protein AABY16_03675 [Nanoarchaeota archaeon]
MKKLYWFIIGIIFLILILIIFGSKEKEPPSQNQMDKWAQALETHTLQIAQGWSEPVVLEVSDGNWGDSITVSPDGNTIYFMWYPGDLLTDQVLSGQPKDPYEYNADIYKSEKPFKTKQKDNRYYFVENPWSAAGPMVDSEGNIFYFSNRFGGVDDQYDNDIYKNSERLAFNNNDNHENPHYCKTLDELWMTTSEDKEILVLKNAMANGFDGVPQLAPPPINVLNSKSTMPWLSDDCNTLYFVTTRFDPEKWRLAIVKSERLGENQWSEPELVISGAKLSVGEVTLTKDEKQLFFEQVLERQKEDGTKEYTTQFYYIEKLQ